MEIVILVLAWGKLKHWWKEHKRAVLWIRSIEEAMRKRSRRPNTKMVCRATLEWDKKLALDKYQELLCIIYEGVIVLKLCGLSLFVSVSLSQSILCCLFETLPFRKVRIISTLELSSLIWSVRVHTWFWRLTIASSCSAIFCDDLVLRLTSGSHSTDCQWKKLQHLWDWSKC